MQTTCSLLECEQNLYIMVEDYNEETPSLAPDSYAYHDLMSVTPIRLSDDICRVFKYWEPFIEWEAANQLLSEPARSIALCPEHIIALSEFNASIEYEDDALIPTAPEIWEEFMADIITARNGPPL